jgi:hypothetical protein
MELTLKTEGGLIKAVAVECEYYPAIELFVNDKLYGLLEYKVEYRQFVIRVYNDDQEDPVFNQKICTI